MAGRIDGEATGNGGPRLSMSNAGHDAGVYLKISANRGIGIARSNPQPNRFDFFFGKLGRRCARSPQPRAVLEHVGHITDFRIPSEITGDIVRSHAIAMRHLYIRHWWLAVESTTDNTCDSNIATSGQLDTQIALLVCHGSQDEPYRVAALRDSPPHSSEAANLVVGPVGDDSPFLGFGKFDRKLSSQDAPHMRCRSGAGVRYSGRLSRSLYHETQEAAPGWERPPWLKGRAPFLLALEALEAIRWCHQRCAELRPILKDASDDASTPTRSKAAGVCFPLRLHPMNSVADARA